MENKNNFDDLIKGELQETFSSPDHINRSLINNCKDKEEFKIINLIFFTILIMQSLLIFLVGTVLVADVFLKIITIGIGILFFNFSLSIYTLIFKKEDVLVWK